MPPPATETLRNAIRKPRTIRPKINPNDPDEKILELSIEDHDRPTTFILYRKGFKPQELDTSHSSLTTELTLDNPTIKKELE